MTVNKVTICSVGFARPLARLTLGLDVMRLVFARGAGLDAPIVLF
jgi:hypothetical protein